MPKGWTQIPDWFSTENQGGSIATADLSGNGREDMIVMMVDNPAGQNRGLYRVGRQLDDAGDVTGGWTPWIEIPDWFSFENEGAGIAVGDVDHDGKQDLFVFMIDNPEAANRGLYRVGRALDRDGNVTGGWGPWIEIPDWFSWGNQYGSIALSDLDGDGNLELIVLMVDNPQGQNRGVYRVGRKLDAQGNITGGWTPWIDVPDWFPWENQAAALALIDVDNNGQLDLLVFMVDNAADQNQAFYKIGSNIDIDGNVNGGWSLWRGVPSWFAWENQGGGIAALRLNGTPRLGVMMVDAPPDTNAGYFRFLPLDNVPARDGSWALLPFHSGVLPVHAALLPTGKVTFFAGSGSSATRFESPIFGNEAQGIFTSVIWDPPQNNFFHPHTLVAHDGRPYDFFCGGDTLLADGRVISVGGTIGYNPFRGRADATVLDLETQQWSFIASMTHGRWYPSAIRLGDGRILAATGLTEDFGNPHNESLEIYSPATDEWALHQFVPGFPGLPLYAHLFLLQDGRILFDGGRMDDDLPVDPCIIDLTTFPLNTVIVPGGSGGGMRNQSASVILPPAQDQRVMIMGGGPAGKPNKTDAIDNVDIVDCAQPDPHFLPAAPLNFPRLHLNAVILPDRTVFVTGGSLKQEDQPLARLQAEIYDPVGDTWSLTAHSTVARLYHSTAVLLPDGRVVSAGGNPEGGTHVQWDQDPEEEMRLEIYNPPYLFKGARPTITSTPKEWHYGQVIDIVSPDAGNIRTASLLSPCVTTHSYDTCQRLVDLPIASQSAGIVRVTISENANIAPTGWYMLFLVTNDGVPCIAPFVHLA